MRTKLDDTKEAAQFFSDTEAWKIFRLAAFGEAIGWSLLISGLIFKHYITPKTNIPVEIVGQIHGTLFILYVAAVLVLHQSMKWSFKKTIVAGLVSIPPYGTLAFEQFEARMRKDHVLHHYSQVNVRGIIALNKKLFLVQHSSGVTWQLPGGPVLASRTIEKSLEHHIHKQLGVKPRVGSLQYMWRNTDSKIQQLDLFFQINNPKDFTKLKQQNMSELDEALFLDPKKCKDLQPTFFQTHTADLISTKSPTTIIESIVGVER